MTDENLRRFLERFREFTIEIEARKKRGQNDFNPLLCVQKIDNEENMHSGFLYALLNPYGEHYQDDLFLKLFVKSIGLQEWFGSTSSARVYKEYGNIDIYITNGTKHIIVENKTKAGDQPKQIERYIEAIAEVDSSDEGESNIEYENIAVVYLAPYIKNPTQQSLGKWHLQGESLVDSENNRVRYKAISYENEIIDWLESALNEAGGISNLRMAIECYTDVVKRLTGQKENTMGIEKFLAQDENMEIVLMLMDKRDSILKEYINKIVEKYKKQIDEQGFEVEYCQWMDKLAKDSFVIRPKRSEGKSYFAFCVEKRTIGGHTAYGVRYIGKNIPEWVKDTTSDRWYKMKMIDFESFESKLLEFLNSSDIKALNEKLKSYQA